MKRYLITACCILAAALALPHCGSRPPSMPEEHRGSLRLVVMDTVTIRSVFVVLDDANLGRRSNPCTIDQVAVGTHKVVASDEVNGQSSAMVEVVQNRRTDATVWLSGDGPYVGKKAPQFAMTTIDGQALELSQMKGTVILLAFFEHT